MKILFLVSSMQGGGAERIAARLCNAWAERGGEVTLMPIAVLRTDSAYMLHKDISLVRLCDIVADSKSKWHRLFALRSFIRKERPDVIVSFLNSVNIATVLSSLGLSIPVIVSERTHPPSYVPPLSHLREKLFRFCYARASAVVAQTGQTKDWLERHIPSAHVVCIPNPVSAELPRNKPVITPESVLASGRRCVFGASSNSVK